ncbi:hypothetical protein [Brevundimonas sp.]|uniref:hypothetical protein n=1 Tax=Brevundimonas sp. TaxID=1871086 RepID=UPI002CBE445D|nr:hypothetical protein [Brevundimonas sp.]HWQ85366.1 hypothetical protein [Brevundimonas sp.]
MIRVAMALAALTTAVPAAAQAPSDSLAYFQQFDRFCLATGGDPARAVAAAEAEGWIAAPQAMVDEAVNPNAPEVAIRLSGPADAAPARLLLSASPPMADRGGLKVRVCAIEPAPGAGLDETRLTALVEARLGFTGAMLPVWVFSGSGPFVDENELILQGREAMAARAATTPIYMLNLVPSGDGGSALALLRMGD